MNKLPATAVLLLMVPALTWAQNADPQPRGLGWAFVGAGSRSMGLTTGFGGEGYVYKGLGIGGADIAVAGIGESNNGNRTNEIGLASRDASYHIFSQKAGGRVAPFGEGGYTAFFGQDTDTPGGNVTSGYNARGGVDIFAARHYGARFDVRYYGHGGRILFASFPNLAQFNFAAYRVGFTFR
jgi:hypothetical protein